MIWRFHDHWHERRPDGIITGVIEALGWDKYPMHDNPRRYAIPATTLEKLAGDIRDRMRFGLCESSGIQSLKIATRPTRPVTQNSSGSAGIQLAGYRCPPDRGNQGMDGRRACP